MLNVPVAKFTTPAEIGRKSLQGIDDIPIIEIEGGIKVFRKRLKDSEVFPHIHRLFALAWRDLQELQEVQGLPTLPPAKDFNTLVSAFKSGHSEVVQVPCDEEDRTARIISLVKEGFAILAYILGEDTLQNEIAGRQENHLLN